jgi:hypothetical protein
MPTVYESNITGVSFGGTKVLKGAALVESYIAKAEKELHDLKKDAFMAMKDNRMLTMRLIAAKANNLSRYVDELYTILDEYREREEND